MSNINTQDHLPDKEKDNYLKLGLKFIPALETALLLLALHQLGFSAGGIVGWVKLGIFGITAYAVSYLIYRMAIEKGATLNSVGYKTAGALSGVSVLLVGIAFFIATAAGLSIGSVEEARLSGYFKVQEVYVDARSVRAAGFAKLAPVITTIADDLESKAACEIKTSCVSGRGSGGYGPTSRMLQTLSDRARGIADTVKAGMIKRRKVQQKLAALQANMSETLADEGTNIWERRAELRKRHVQLNRLLNRLDEAVPASLITSYARELRSGISIPKRAEVSKTINRILNGYAGSIEAAFAGIKRNNVTRANFPSRTGAMDTFAYAANYAPVFLLAFLIDVTFPIALWAYTVV